LHFTPPLPLPYFCGLLRQSLNVAVGDFLNSFPLFGSPTYKSLPFPFLRFQPQRYLPFLGVEEVPRFSSGSNRPEEKHSEFFPGWGRPFNRHAHVVNRPSSSSSWSQAFRRTSFYDFSRQGPSRAQLWWSSYLVSPPPPPTLANSSPNGSVETPPLSVFSFF